MSKESEDTMKNFLPCLSQVLERCHNFVNTNMVPPTETTQPEVSHPVQLSGDLISDTEELNENKGEDEDVTKEPSGADDSLPELAQPVPPHDPVSAPTHPDSENEEPL